MSMSNVLRFHAPGPWITRDLKECVLASDYDALAVRCRKYEEALLQIAKGEGTFSRDNYQFACNVIEESKRLATEALHNEQA
jgi:hypothetical protein